MAQRLRRFALCPAITLSIAMALAAPATAETQQKPRPLDSRPNVLIIVADDLGLSDLGAFGGEIATPNLDALARRGVMLSNFHTAPTCSPTRSMLLTGVDSHRAGMGSMAEILTPQQKGQPGYEGYLSTGVATIAERLRAAGYFTAMAGKWHLGMEADQSPAARGFDRSFALLQGGGDHWGGDQGEGWKKSGWQTNYREGMNFARYPEGAYSADVFAGHMSDYLDEAHKAGRPFFAYLTFTEPHWPLQAPAEDVAKYHGRYDGGPAALRAERIKRMTALGLIPAGMKSNPPVDTPEWAALSPDQRAIESRKMEVYAAMVDRMDRNVGHVMDRLRANGQLDNTVVIFLSDNGAEGQAVNGLPPIRPVPAEDLPRIDNSLANIGKPGSYVSYGPAWAQAASPYYLYKAYTTEGGIRTPAFISGGAVKGGRIAGGFTHVRDIAPTILQLTGTPAASVVNGRASAPIEGKSMMPLLSGRARAIHGPAEATGWELFYFGAIRVGDWKAVRLPAKSSLGRIAKTESNKGWQLFNLARDPGETTDLAPKNPGKLSQMLISWRAYVQRNKVLLPENYDGETAIR